MYGDSGSSGLGGHVVFLPTHPVAVLIKDGYPKAWYPQLSLELRCTYNYEAMFDRCTLILGAIA